MTPNEDRFTLSLYTDPEPYASTSSTTQKLQLHTPRPALTSSSSSTSRFLQPEPPISPPLPSPSPSTPTSSRKRPIYIPPPISTSPTEIKPLPSLPRSFLLNSGISERDVAGHRLSFLDVHSDMGEHEVYEMDGKDGVGDKIEQDAEAVSPLPIMTRGFSVGSSKALSWWQKIIPTSIPCRLLLATVILESLVDLAIEGNILWRFNAEVKSTNSTNLELENKRRLPVYLVIFGLAHIWQLVLTVIAIRQKNTVQVTALTAFNFAFLGYAIVEIEELRSILGTDLSDGLDVDTESDLMSLPLNILTYVVIGVIAICSVILLVLAYFLRREFGMQRYRFLGADLQIRKYYFHFQVFECICYFSAFFCAGFGIQFIWLILQKTDVEYIITWVAFPLSILLLIIGRFAAKYENKPFMASFFIGILAGCAYFTFKMVRIWQQHHTTYAMVTRSLTVFGALSLGSLVACLGSGVVVWLDFGKGLKVAVLEQQGGSGLARLESVLRGRGRSGSGSTGVEENEMGVQQQRRISID